MTDGPEVTPPPDRPRPGASAAEPRRTPLEAPRRDAAPRGANYAARRMLISTLAVAAVVVAGVFAWRLTRDETATDVGQGAAWTEVVFVDRATGALTAVAPDDLSAAARAPATGRVTAVHVQGEHVALVQANQLTLTTLGDDQPTIIPTARGSIVTRLAIPDTLWLAVGSSSGRNILLVDGLTGTIIDVAELTGQSAPRYYVDNIRFDAGGDTIAIADAGNFQTLVVHTDTKPPGIAFFPDIPIAVTADRVLTSQVVGQEAAFTLLDADQQTLAEVKGALPAAGVIDGDDVTVVFNDGTVSRFGPDDTEAEQLGAVVVPATATISLVRTSADGTRFVVFGDVFEAIVDLDGKTLFSTTFAAAVDAPTIAPDWTCLPVGGGTAYHSLVDLESGEQLADLTGMAVTSVAADGCTVLGTRAGVTAVVGRDGSVELGETTNAVLAPDGRAVVVQTAAGTTQLLPIDDWSLGDPVDLTALTPQSAVITFRGP